MKKFTQIALILLVGISFISCSSEDDGGDTTPITQEVTATLDLNDLANLSGTDATALISFNGIPAAQYTTEAIAGDEIRYKVTTSDPNKFVRFVEFHYSSGSETLWNDGLERILDFSGRWLEGLQVLSGVNTGDELKFDIDFQIEENGQLQSTVYTIDPKIKIKSRR